MGSLSSDDSRRTAYRKLSIPANFFRILAGDCAYAVSAWLVLILLVKLGSEQLVGMYAIGVAICTPVFMLMNLGLTGGLITDRSGPCPYGRYLTLRLLTAGLSIPVVAVVVFAIDYSPNERTVVLLVACSTSVAVVREMFLAQMKRYECMNLVGMSQAIVAGAVLVAFSATFWVTRSLPWSVVAIGAARVIVLLSYDLPHVRGLIRTFDDAKIELAWSLRPLIRLGATTAPLAAAMALASFAQNIPRYFLERFHGAGALGFFAAMAAIVALGTRMMNALGTAVMPRLAEYYAKRRSAYRRLTLKLLLIGLGLGLVAILIALLFGRKILTLLFSREFANMHGEFVLLMVYMGIMFLVSLTNQALVASRAFTRVSLVNAGVCAASLAFSWWLIRPLGLRGACWAMIAVSTCWFGLLAITYVVRARPEGGLREVSEPAEWPCRF